MAQESKIEVINPFGWRKEFVLQKGIIHVGSNDRNDIVLVGGDAEQVQPRHAQILPSTLNRQGYRLVNLSTLPIAIRARHVLDSDAGVVLEPRGSAEIADGDRARIGGFSLIFHGGEQRSAVMKLDMKLSSTELGLDTPITGTLVINHIGNKAGVQFKLELDGLDAAYYELGPGPVLFPNAQREVAFRLNHPKKPFPRAGETTIAIHVSAPDAYPDEKASISRSIQIAPYYGHKLRVLPMDSAEYRLA
ncbi:MAG: hypothetical protein HC802_21120 [Caldilineaceae bacterium]|nr:hypothetical protein [Caldilineaceae bacterium]